VKCYINSWEPLGLDVDPGDTETGLGDGEQVIDVHTVRHAISGLMLTE
jgi:hypothetical protein